MQLKYPRASRKFSLILEMGMHNPYISKIVLKKRREKNWEFSTPLADSREKKTVNQSNLTKMLINIQINGDVETAFRLPSGVKEDFIRNL